MAENPRIEDLRRKLERDPGSRLFAQLAEELRKEGDLGEAIRVARAGLAQHPNYPSARMTLGRAFSDSGDLAAARSEFEAVLRGAPDNILASRFLAECLEGMGDLGSALLQYRAALRLAPGERQIESQIRALEQKLTPPRRSPEPGPPAAAAVVAAVVPPEVAEPMPRAAQAPLPPDLPPPTVLLPAAAIPGGRSEAPLPAPVVPSPPQADAAAPVVLDESFELEAPFGAGGRLHAAEPAPRRTLDFEAPPEAPFAAPEDVPAEAAPPAAPVLAPATAEPVEVGPPPTAWYLETSPGHQEAAAPLSSSTLAELYFRQGFVDKAIEVYRQLLRREPDNDQARGRLDELTRISAPAPATPPGEARSPAGPTGAPDSAVEARRRAIEKTISRLEELLGSVRRNATALGAR